VDSQQKSAALLACRPHTKPRPAESSTKVMMFTATAEEEALVDEELEEVDPKSAAQ